MNCDFNYKGRVLWFTGLSGAGKSTLANLTYHELEKRGFRVERLDGDVVRKSLTRDLSFSRDDRDENIRRIGFVANLLSRNGVIVVASFITPYERQRQELREKVIGYVEIFVDTPLEACEARDVKGLYAMARRGEIKNFTGIDDDYEKPKYPNLHIKTSEKTPKDCALEIMDYLKLIKLVDVE